LFWLSGFVPRSAVWDFEIIEEERLVDFVCFFSGCLNKKLVRRLHHGTHVPAGVFRQDLSHSWREKMRRSSRSDCVFENGSQFVAL
jgi:hypothetical protein